MSYCLWGFCVCHCFVMNYFVSNLVFNHIEEKEEAGCFAFIVLHMPCYCKCYVTLFLLLP